jgi:hypothetical protein
MVEIEHDALVFRFPEVHPSATLRVTFQRTLRIPDDDKDYPLPPGLGRFPLRHLDDFAARAPAEWVRRGGIVLPMYQCEALWLSFDPESDGDRGVEYPFAIKIAAGKINAVTGAGWSDGLDVEPQDYVVAPEQPWLDGFCVERGIIRQFVAMPLGRGYTAEEQLTGAAEFGGLQIVAYPMKREVFERRFPVRSLDGHLHADRFTLCAPPALACEPVAMGLAPGGRMRQAIEADPYDPRDWDRSARSRCFVHLCNAIDWPALTGERPAPTPADAAAYTTAGLPWFEWYGADAKALRGSRTLAWLKSVQQLAAQKKDVDVPVVAPISPEHIVKLRAGLKPSQVRDSGDW